jgi:hypothetical protein
MHSGRGLFGFAANNQVGFAINQEREALADDGVVIDH